MESEGAVRVRGGDELRELVGREPLVLAEFHSRSCPKCDAQAPVLGLLAREFEGTVAMVDPGEGLGLRDTSSEWRNLQTINCPTVFESSPARRSSIARSKTHLVRYCGEDRQRPQIEMKLV